MYEQLRAALRDGAYPADAKILEHTVATEYGVSRTPAREALMLLVRDGLLVQEGRSFRLPVLTPDEITDLFHVRRLLEPNAVALVALRASDEDLAELERLAAREFQKHGQSASYAAANRLLRGALFELCPNKRLVGLIASQEDQIALIRQLTLVQPEVRRLSVEVFSEVLVAVVGRDAENASRRMETLLNEAQAATLAQIQAAPTQSRATRAR